MFKFFEDTQPPKEIVNGLVYELYPSNSISLRPQTSGIISFGIELKLDFYYMATIEILPQYTLKGLIAPNVSFHNTEILQLPVFYSFFPINGENLSDYLFSRNTIFITPKDAVAKLWIRKLS